MKWLTILSVFIFSSSFSQEKDTSFNSRFVHRSTILSTIIPAAGQIHNNKIRPIDNRNRLWWKVPIIYGGLSFSGSLIIFNQSQFSSIRKERLNRLNGAAINLYPEFQEGQLKTIQDQYRRQRDLSIIAFLGVYALQIIDANVEANLFLFDSSDKLSFNLNTESFLFNDNKFTPALAMGYRF